MAIKKAGLPNWYIILYSIVCIFDGVIGLFTIGYYTSNLQLIVAFWYLEYTGKKNMKMSVKSANPPMYISED